MVKVWIHRGLLLGCAMSPTTILWTAQSDAATKYQVVAAFHYDTEGCCSYGGAPTTDKAGNVYATLPFSSFGNGTLSKISPDGTVAVLHAFSGSDGNGPSGGVLNDEVTGKIFGTTCAGGANDYGVLYELDPDGTYKILHDFDGTNEGACPVDAPLRDRKTGDFFGVANYYGPGGYGTVWKLSPEGTFTVLHAFNNDDGAYPSARLIKGHGGKLYGTTNGGGPHRDGTIFSITHAGNFQTLYNFDNTTGAFPTGFPTLDKSGNLYTLANAGGTHGKGTIFKLDPSGTPTVIHNFNNDAGGAEPDSSLLLLDDKLYGTTVAAGDPTCGCGTVFQAGLDGSYVTLHTFVGSSADGAHPHSGLAKGRHRFLYGTTYEGGVDASGTVFKVRP